MFSNKLNLDKNFIDIVNLLRIDNDKIRYDASFFENINNFSAEEEISDESVISQSNNDDIIEIFRNLKNGSEKAFSLFYEKTFKSVYYKLLTYVKNPETANDLSQDVYLEFYKNAKRIKEDKSCVTFLFIMVKNIALNYLRLTKNNLEFDDSIDIGLEEDNKLDINLIFALLRDEIKVNEKDEDILLLHVIQGYSFNDIAAMYDCNLNTVITKYNRTIKKIQKYFIEKGGALNDIWWKEVQRRTP